MAADQGEPPRVSNASVLISVKDNNTDVISVVDLSSDHIPLVVGMAMGWRLPLNVTTTNAANVNISAGNEGGWFKLTDDGYIILERNITEVAVFELTVTATSITGYKASQQVQVAAVPLSFDQPDYITTVTENNQAPLSLVDLNSYPESLGIPVVYFLSEPSDVFSIDTSSGSLTLVQQLDREITSIHVLDIRLRLQNEYDGASAARASVVVRVKDKNDNVPNFGSIGPKLRLDIPENITAPWSLATITAFDLDEGLNGLIAYSITDGDATAFSINRDTGNLKLEDNSRFDKLGVSISRLTVLAVDRNGTGQAASLVVEVHSVKQLYQFKLLAPVSSSTFTNNQNAIVRQLSDILSLQLVVDDVLVHSDESGLDTNRADVLIHALDPQTNASVPVDSIQRKVTDKEAEISQVFQSYMDEVTVRKSPSDDGFSAATVALIAIGCIMFVLSIIAILVVVRLWKRQKEYAEREETAVRARQRVEERLARQKETANATASSKISDDPDHEFEM
ncbi:cadherin-89D [Elysia marginata]|uniref:Cadherin-89D n=1 Tax=Elysia marginata TaxID=1093978 RepID=A0AAV4IA31_9GAST|nr:cadherin-89D [Elysia marginata]